MSLKILPVFLSLITTSPRGWWVNAQFNRVQQCSTEMNTLKLRQNSRHVADNIFKFIFLYEFCCTLIEISLKFVANGPINNKTSIGTDNVLALNRQQAIISTNNGLVYWYISHYQGRQPPNFFSVFCWKNFRILSKFSVSLNLLHTITLGKRNTLFGDCVAEKIIQTLSLWAKITLSRCLFLRIATFVVLRSVQMSLHERCLAKSLFALSGHGCCEYSGMHILRLYFFVWKMYWPSTSDASPLNCCLHCKITHCFYMVCTLIQGNLRWHQRKQGPHCVNVTSQWLHHVRSPEYSLDN